MKNLFTLRELDELITNYGITFDMVNIVDIDSEKILIVKDKSVIKSDDLCFSSNFKNIDFNNLTSKDISLLSRKTILQEYDDKLYLITTLPIDLIDNNRNINNYILELVMDLTNEYKRKNNSFKEFKEIYTESFKDELTGVYNYEYFDTKEYIKDLKDKEEYSFTYIIADVHRYEKIKKIYGETIGNKIMSEVSKILVHNLRPDDKVIRLKSERFIIILKNTDEEFIKTKIELLRNKIKSIIYDKENGYFPIIAFGYKTTVTKEFNEEIEAENLDDAIEMLENEKMFS